MSNLRQFATATLTLKSGTSIVLDTEVLTLLQSYVQTGSRPEAGGILLGYRRGVHLDVVAATVPAPQDVQSHWAFVRKDASHQQVAARWWEQSGGRVDYLGEWHTHPQTQPTPSSVDMREWGLLERRNPRPLLFLIVGTQAWFAQYQGEHCKFLPTLPPR